MKFEIKNRLDGTIIFSGEFGSIKLCVIAAVSSRANLSGADLYGADLSGANLSRADLSRADLSRADLSGADLSRADLSGADLSGADLSRSDLSGADLSGADLSRADLSRADLSRADLSGAKESGLIFAKQRITPSEGSFVGWKKLQGDIIARLVIPHDAERMNALGSRKCRASRAFVHELFGAEEAYDKHTGTLLYKQGVDVIPDKYDPDVRVECSHGIHFFMTREEAEDY